MTTLEDVDRVCSEKVDRSLCWVCLEKQGKILVTRAEIKEDATIDQIQRLQSAMKGRGIEFIDLIILD